MMRSYENAAAVLTQLLGARGIDANTLSSETGIDAGTLRALLCGRKKSISTRNLAILARYFGYSIPEFVDKLALSNGVHKKLNK